MFARDQNHPLLCDLDELLRNNWKINITTCDAFEESILEMANIEIKPYNCRFLTENKDSPVALIAYAISNADEVTKKLLQLNSSYPELQIKVVTNALKIELDLLAKSEEKLSTEQFQRLQFLKKQVPFSIRNQVTVIFEMNIQGIYKHIIPFMTQLFTNNPKLVEHYQQYLVSKTEFRTAIYEVFHPVGMAPFAKESRCYVETLGRVAQQSFYYQGLTDVLVSIKFPKPLAGIVNQHLNAIELEDAKDCDIKLHEQMKEFETPDHNTVFRMSSTTTASMMQKFFNGYIPKSASVAIDTKDFFNHIEMTVENDSKTSEPIVKFEAKPDQKSQPVNLIVSNQVLTHPTLLSEMKSVLFSYPRELSEVYLKQSGAINHTFQECQNELKKINEQIQGKKSLVELYNAIEILLKFLADKKFCDKHSLSIQLSINVVRSKYDAVVDIEDTEEVTNEEFHLIGSIGGKLTEVLSDLSNLANKKFEKWVERNKSAEDSDLSWFPAHLSSLKS